MMLRVTEERIGEKLHRLSICSDGTYIGEYERSQLDDIFRKKREVANAATHLLAVYNKHGPFIVRWDGKARQKSIRSTMLRSA